MLDDKWLGTIDQFGALLKGFGPVLALRRHHFLPLDTYVLVFEQIALAFDQYAPHGGGFKLEVPADIPSESVRLVFNQTAAEWNLTMRSDGTTHDSKPQFAVAAHPIVTPTPTVIELDAAQIGQTEWIPEGSYTPTSFMSPLPAAEATPPRVAAFERRKE